MEGDSERKKKTPYKKRCTAGAAADQLTAWKDDTRCQQETHDKTHTDTHEQPRKKEKSKEPVLSGRQERSKPAFDLNA